MLKVRSILALAIALGSSPVAVADPSWFGTTGLLRTPTAEVQDEGVASFSASNFDANLGLVESNWAYSVDLGIWNNVEVNGRLVERIDGPSYHDLSVDLKYRFLDFDNGIGVAAGLQDFGGQLDLFRARYAVATLPWRSLSASVGYGDRGSALDGWFGGAEWSPSAHFSLIAEYANEETFGGIRVSSGSWLGRVKASLTAAYGSLHHDTEFGLALTFPLGATYQAPTPQPKQTNAAAKTPQDLSGLEKSYREAGFEAVRVGTRPDGRVVAVAENRRYNHSAVDGVGVALARAAEQLGPEQDFELVLTSYSVPQLAISVPMQAWNTFRDGGSDAEFRKAWQVRPVNRVSDAAEIEWQSPPTRLSTIEVIAEPAVRNFVGTDAGVVDFGLGARVRAVMTFAPGLVLTAGTQVPLVRTDDFRDDGDYAGLGPEPGLYQSMVGYFHKPLPSWSSLWSLGAVSIFNQGTTVAAMEQQWLSPTGRHQARMKLMQIKSEWYTSRIALAGYTWFDAARRYSVSITGGRFFDWDTGARLELNRYFGDTIIGFHWRVADRYNQIVGVQVSLPLTPRKDMRPDRVQFKGSRRWGWSLGSTVSDPSGRNPLRPLLIYEPSLDLDLRRDFSDSGRLNPGFFDANTERLREAAGL